MEFSVGKLGDLRVSDVYELASQIGKEFEVIIDNYGLEVVTSLMPKVINSLEHMEACALKSEQKDDEVSELQAVICKLESEKHERAEYRVKFEEEVEQIEENWRKESSQLSELVSRLQEENQRLSNLLAEKESFNSDKSKVESVTDDVKLAQKLKELVDKQREQLHAKDRELLHRSADIDKLQEQSNELAQSNSEHSRRFRNLQSQVRLFVEEKSDLQAQVQDQQRELQVLQKQLHDARKENMDLVEGSPKMDLRRKLVIDPDDPNRPRFTLEELRNLLFEKNDLKARVSELEDELSLYKPKPITPVVDETDSANYENETDLPVQGPINREPEDKLYPRKRSLGIRRFFRTLWRGLEPEHVAINPVPFSAFRQ